jgi:DnaJ-class molecular chaperone
MNHYLLLKISENASQDVIERAFADFKADHEKYCPGVEIKDEDLKAQFPDIYEAYTILLNPISKREYDLRLKNQEHKNKIEISEEVQMIEVNLKQKIIKMVYMTGLILFILFLIYSMSTFFKL